MGTDYPNFAEIVETNDLKKVNELLEKDWRLIDTYTKAKNKSEKDLILFYSLGRMLSFSEKLDRATKDDEKSGGLFGNK